MSKWLRSIGDLIRRWLSFSFSFIIFAAMVVFVWAGIRALFSDTFLIICLTIPIVVLVYFGGLMLIGLIVTIVRLIFKAIDWRNVLWTVLAGTLLILLCVFLPHSEQKEADTSPRPRWMFESPVPAHQDPSVTYRRPEPTVTLPPD